MTPNLAFEFCCSSCLLVDPPSRQTGLLALWNMLCLFLLLYFCFFSFPTVDCHPSIIACQNPIHPSKGREAVKCFLGPSTFMYYFTKSTVLILWGDTLAPLYRWGRLRKVISSPEVTQLKVTKMDFRMFKPGWSFHRSPGPVCYIY
jgi:hypothetical protein